MTNKKRMLPGHDGFRCFCGVIFTTIEEAMSHLLTHALVDDEMEYKDAINMLYHTHCCMVNDVAYYVTQDKRSITLDLTQFEIDVLVDGLLKSAHDRKTYIL